MFFQAGILPVQTTEAQLLSSSPEGFSLLWWLARDRDFNYEASTSGLRTERERRI